MKKVLLIVAGLIAGVAMNSVAVETAFAACPDSPNDGCVCTMLIGEVCEDVPFEDPNNGIRKVLQIVINILTGGVGIAAVIGIALAGVQYMTAGGNEAQMVKAKSRIIQVVIGLVVWALMWAALNFLIPGGLV